MRALAGVAIFLLSSACVRYARPAVPVLASEWAATLATARAAVLAGDHDDADSTLVNFTRVHGGTPEAREAEYWRGLFKLDPANRRRSASEALPHLDRYLSDTIGLVHLVEARAIRILAGTLDSLAHTVTVITSAQSAQAVDSGFPPREQEMVKEIQRLKDQLDKTNAELERIKRRLAAPTP
ncbi:MAG: hypothetical protein ABR543_12750 [Gemmatimonadaceae bacterium]